MAHKPKPRSCIWGKNTKDNCTNGAIVGMQVCREHAHPLILQQEILRLQDTRVTDRWESLLVACDSLRMASEKLQALRRRMEVGKNSSVARIHSSGFSDGTVEYGNTVVLGAAAAVVKSEEGRWGAAVRLVGELDRELGRLLDPSEPKKKDMRITCGQCPDPNTRHRRQAPDSRFCRWCGRSFIEKEGAA